MEFVILALSLALIFQWTKYNREKARHKYGFPHKGEAFVDAELKKSLEKKYHHVISNVTLPVGGGTTQIDHVVICDKGIFAIETKDYNGIVYAGTGRDWYQYMGKKKYPFQNPHRQNYKHIMALKEILPFVSGDLFFDEVVFVGDAEIKNAPERTHKGIGSLMKSISAKERRLTKSEMVKVIGVIEYCRKYDGEETDAEHRAYLMQKRLSGKDNIRNN